MLAGSPAAMHGPGGQDMNRALSEPAETRGYAAWRLPVSTIRHKVPGTVQLLTAGCGRDGPPKSRSSGQSGHGSSATRNQPRRRCDGWWRPLSWATSPSPTPLLSSGRDENARRGAGAGVDATGWAAPRKVRQERVAAVQRQPLGRVPRSSVRGEPGGLRRSGYSSPQVDGFAGRWSPGGAPSTVFSAAIPPRAAPAMPPTIAPGGPPTIAPVTSPAMAPAIAPPNAASR
jgi:hypothetical protein